MPKYQLSDMALKIKRARRNMGTRRRRLNRGYSGYKRRYNLYHFKRSVYLADTLSVDALVNTSTSYGFTLGQLPDASNFIGLYDEYRINKVIIKFIPKYTDVILNTAGVNASMQQLHTAIDYDDSLALPSATALNEITQYQSHKFTQGNRIHTRVLVPKIELSVGGGGQAPKSRQWLDCDNSTVLHNGVKVFIPRLNVAATVFYDVQITTYLSFRNVL
jgi:hypothetical protein